MTDLVVFVVFVGGLFVYFLPAVVAMVRRHTNLDSLVALNFFLGWTVVGWVVALCWALSVGNLPREDGGGQ